jgi:Domain of unknown function (DUF4337)
MPEEIEIDTDKLRETIDEEVERAGGGRILRWISLTTAVLAALAAIASLRAGATVNEALVLKTEATRLQAQASDQWAYYQAKGIKGAITQSDMNAWRASGKLVPPALPAEATRYSAQQDTIRKAALRLEQERDRRSAEADILLEQHHSFAASVALFQIAIALGAIAALTRVSLVWIGSLVAGAIGVILMAIPILGGK